MRLAFFAFCLVLSACTTRTSAIEKRAVDAVGTSTASASNLDLAPVDPPAPVALEVAPALPVATDTPSPIPPLPVETPPTPAPPGPTPTPFVTVTVTAPAATAPPAPTGARSQVVSRGRADRRAVTLTFDAGSDRGHAERILDILAGERVKAAFGITGEWGNANRDLLARITRDDHTLINHSWDHSSFTGVSWNKVARTRAERESQLSRTQQVFASTGAPATPYFRPPFGDYDQGVLVDVGALGYPTTVMWSVDSMGWRGWGAPQIAQRCLEGAHAGAIYIFHVGSVSQDAEALAPIIEGLRARNYEIVPLADLLAAGPS